MHTIIRRLTALALCAALCLSCAPVRADGSYLIEDSNTRRLARAELWEWSLEGLGYVLNEIFARHGYNFIPGEKYDNYFRTKSWYVPNANSNNQQACYPKLSNLEWDNEALVKQVMNEMRAMGTTNPGGKTIARSGDRGLLGGSALSGFTRLTSLQGGQVLNVYSSSSASSWRGAGGKASVSTNGEVYAAGWDNGWLLVMYETNAGAVRVGYVSGNAIRGYVSNNVALHFDYRAATVQGYVALTDDPVRCSTAIVQLCPGDTVIYLSSYFNNASWDYVQTTCGTQVVRGFIPSGYLN